MNFKMTVKPGATKSKKDDGVVDLEQHFVLRMPPGPAMALRRDVESGSMTLKDKLYIEIQNDMRHGCVRYGESLFKAKLVDMPCIVETLKTTDQKTFYKAADISQMLLCVSDDESSGEEDQQPDPNKKNKDKEKKYMYNHGITPPLKNVRKRRFRKTLKKKYPEQPDIEKEVKRLLRMDNEAIDVKWEVVVEEEKGAEDGEAGQTSEHVLAHGETNKDGKTTAAPSTMPLVYDIFGELSSSLESDTDDGEETTQFTHINDTSHTITMMSNNDSECQMDISETSMQLPADTIADTSMFNISYLGYHGHLANDANSRGYTSTPLKFLEQKNGDVPGSDRSGADMNCSDELADISRIQATCMLNPKHDIFGELSSSDDDGDINIMDSGEEQDESSSYIMKPDDSKDESNMGQGDASELQDKLSELEWQLETLQKKRIQVGMELDMTQDTDDKERLQRELESVIQEENEKQKEFQILSSMLNQ